jgi:hypothetical protein
MENLPENIEVLENFPAYTTKFSMHMYTEIFLGWSANMVKFQVLENLPAKA